MAADPQLFDIMYSMRAMRRLKTDPVPDELIEKIIEAGTMAPSGGNAQGWSFLVVTDPEKKKFIQERYHTAFAAYAQANMAQAQQQAEETGEEPDPAQLRLINAAFHLADHLHEAPVLLFACTRPRPGALGGITEGASIYPAVQNMLLTIRALGLGSVLTTLHKVFDNEIKAELGVPDDIDMSALLPIGWPKGKFGPVSRRPAAELTYWNAWGATK